MESPRADPVQTYDEAVLPWAVERETPGSDWVTVARTSTSALGFSAYYAAMREYPEAALRLTQAGRSLANHRP